MLRSLKLKMFSLYSPFFFPLPDATKVQSQSDRYFVLRQTCFLIGHVPELTHQIQALSRGRVECSGLDTILEFSLYINEIILIF